MADDDNRTWIKWTKLNDGKLLKYHGRWFTKLDQTATKSRLLGAEDERLKKLRVVEERLNNHIIIAKRNNNKAAKQKRLEYDGTVAKRGWVKFDEAIERVRDHSVWRMWESLGSGASKIFNFNGREFRKDVWSDEEKLMTQIINCIKSNKQGTEKRRQIKQRKERTENSMLFTHDKGNGSEKEKIVRESNNPLLMALGEVDDDDGDHKKRFGQTLNKSVSGVGDK
jgi:hypothetical protein